jgi:hypothetical protein
MAAYVADKTTLLTFSASKADRKARGLSPIPAAPAVKLDPTYKTKDGASCWTPSKECRKDWTPTKQDEVDAYMHDPLTGTKYKNCDEWKAAQKAVMK